MRIKGEKGITLIALVITIIILIILAGVTISVLLNRDGLINKSIDAKEQYVISEITERLNLYGFEKQAENLGKVGIDEYLEYVLAKNEYTIDVEDNEDNTNFAKYLLVNGEYEFLVEEKGNGTYIYVEYLGKIGERDGLVLSEYEGEITYPNNREFRIVKNASKGELSVVSSNPEVASVSLDEKKVTITPKILSKQQEEVTITVLSAGKGVQPDLTTEYKAIVKQGKIEVVSTEYNGLYDGLEHGITVTVIPKEATVLYSEDGINYNLTEPPKYTDVTTRTTYFKAFLDGYTTVSNSSTVTINKIKDAQAPVVAAIELSGDRSVTSLPATIYATVTHQDEEGTATTEGSGIDISRCKYVLNTTSGKIGTDSNSYTNSFSSNGEKITLTLSTSGTSYYLHVLSVDNEGNMNETVKGPIKVTTNYHVHTGSSSSGGGCYGSPNYHSHTSSCYTTTYHYHSGSSSSGGGCYTKANYSSGSDYRNCPYGYEHTHTGSNTAGTGCYTGKKTTTYTCGKTAHTHSDSCYGSVTKNCEILWSGPYGPDTSGRQYWKGQHINCGAEDSTSYSGPGNTSHTYTVKSSTRSCGYSYEHTHKASCKSTTYALGCGLSEHTHTSSCEYTWNYISSYSLNCGYSNGQATGSYLSCGKGTYTIDSYSLNCGKSTSTIVGYTISY